MKTTTNIMKELKNSDLSPILLGKKEGQLEWLIFDINEYLDEDSKLRNNINNIELLPYEFQLIDGSSLKIMKDFLNKTELPEEKLNTMNTRDSVFLFEFMKKLWNYASFS